MTEHPDWVFKREGSQWVVYDAYEDSEYGYLVIGEELARHRKWSKACALAHQFLAGVAAAQERDDIARAFEEQLFGLTVRERWQRKHSLWSLGLVEKMLPTLPTFANYEDALAIFGPTATIEFRTFKELDHVSD